MLKVNLTSRQKRILSMLNARHGVYSGKELSSGVGVSDRTLRTDISDLNGKLKGTGIFVEAQHGKGYILTVSDRSALLELFAEMENYETRDDRLQALLLKLLHQDDWYDVGELQDDMYVSHATLAKDLRDIRKKVTYRYPYLKIERKGNLIRVENDERKKRHLLIQALVDAWDYDSKEGIVLKRENFDSQKLRRIQELLNQHLLDSEIYLDDYAFIYLTVTIVVMILRIQEGYQISHEPEILSTEQATVETEPETKTSSQSQVYADIAKEVIGLLKTEDKVISEYNNDKNGKENSLGAMLEQLEKEWHIPFSKEEYEYLLDIKQQLVFLCEKNTQRDFIFLSRTDDVSRQIVDELRMELLKVYGVDFTEDDQFLVGLTRHIQGLRTGMISPAGPNHVLGEELRKKYPFLGDVVHYMRYYIEQKIGMELGALEEDYLLPPVILAEESLYQKRRGSGIPTAVISHFNDSTTMCLMNLLKQHYGEILNLYGPFTVHERDLINQKETHLILSTVKQAAFNHHFSIPVLTVSPLLDATDQMGIDLYLFSLKSSYMYKTPDLQMVHYFPQELCYRLDTKNNILPLLAEISDRARKFLGLFRLERIDMENDYYCVLPNGLMFYYQINNEIPRSTVSLVDLGKETSCKYVRNVKTIMFMLMPERERHTLGWFYYLAMALAQYPKELKAVFEGKSLEDLTINISRKVDS